MTININDNASVAIMVVAVCFALAVFFWSQKS